MEFGQIIKFVIKLFCIMHNLLYYLNFYNLSKSLDEINYQLLKLINLFAYNQILNLSNDVNYLTLFKIIMLNDLFLKIIMVFLPILVILHYLPILYSFLLLNLIIAYFIKIMSHFEKIMVLVILYFLNFLILSSISYLY